MPKLHQHVRNSEKSKAYWTGLCNSRAWKKEEAEGRAKLSYEVSSELTWVTE